MKWKWIDADCTSVTTAEGTLTLKGLFIPLFIEQLLMNMTGTVNKSPLTGKKASALTAVITRVGNWSVRRMRRGGRPVMSTVPQAT